MIKMPKTEQKKISKVVDKKASKPSSSPKSKSSSSPKSKPSNKSKSSQSSKVQIKTKVVVKKTKKSRNMKGGDGQIELPTVQEYSKLDMNNWISILNSGQRNKGSWEHKNKLLFMMKKAIEVEPYTEALKIGVFPKVIALYNDETSPGSIIKYIVTDKLDGDMTSIFTSYIPTQVANAFAKNENNSNLAKSLMELFYMKMPSTMKNGKSIGMNHITELQLFLLNNPNTVDEYEEEYLNLQKPLSTYESISKMNFRNMVVSYPSSPEYIRADNDKLLKLKALKLPGVTLELYDKFMEEVTKKIYEIYPMVCKNMESCMYELFSKNYEYGDRKFDNFGYKLIDNETKIVRGNSTYCSMLDGKLFLPYIIDVEAASKIKSDTNVDKIKQEESVKKDIQNDVSNKFTSYTINGQYNLRSLQRETIVGSHAKQFIKMKLLNHWREKLLKQFQT